MNIPTDVSRRKFLKNSTGLAAGLMAASSSISSAAPARSPKAQYMGDFAAPKLDTVRVAMIGVGARGKGHTQRLANIEGTEIVAICDLYEDYVMRAKGFCDEAGKGERHTDIKLYHGKENNWKKMLREVKPDMVLIATPWEDHAPMAIEAMKQGAHAFVEVPLALTNQELWDIVDTSEKTGKHCMMMENVNYGRVELLYLNLCRKGIIGDLLHGEAAYIHELRKQMNAVERGTGSWRTYHYANRNGNPMGRSCPDGHRGDEAGRPCIRRSAAGSHQSGAVGHRRYVRKDR